MAATVSVLGTSVLNTTAGNKTITATPTVGDLIVIITVSTGVATTVADNGTGGTYTQVESTRTGFSTTGNLQMWVRDNIIASASSTIYTATQTSSTGGGLVILRVTGMAVAGASAVRTSGGQSSGTLATTPAPVLSNTPYPGNPIITAIGNASNSTTTVIQRTGYAEDFDNGYNTPPTGLEVSHLASGETSATITYGGASATAFASIAIELAYNTTPTVALNTPADTATDVSTTPDLAFTGTDTESETIEYEVQVDTVSTFDSSVGFSQSAGDFVNGISMQGGTNTSGESSQAGAQTFTPASNFSANTITVTATKIASPIDNGTVTVRTGSETGTILASGSFPLSTLPTNPSTLDIGIVLDTTISFSTLTTYYIVFDRSSGIHDSTNRYNVFGSNANPTSTGVMRQRANNTWTTLIGGSGIFDLKFNLSVPLLDKRSVTPDATFTDVTNGAHTHPFVSGEQVKYTIQAGDILAASTVYYWRARGLDPSGTNTFGLWSTTRSFTTASAGNPPVGKDITDLNNNFGAYVSQAVNRLGSF